MKSIFKIGLKKVSLFVIAAAFVFAGTIVPAAPAHAATAYVKYSWSNDVYKVVNGQSGKYVSAAQYAAAGSPSVQTVGWIPGSKIYNFKTSTQELFLWPPDDNYGNPSYRHLTLAEWNATGNQPRNGTVLIGFVKTPSNPDIYHVPGCGSSNKYYKLSYNMWSYYGFPTPQVSGSIPSCV